MDFIVMKFMMGIAVGVVLTMFAPDIVPAVKKVFIESGARDKVVEIVGNVK
jgi:hypothetical protein